MTTPTDGTAELDWRQGRQTTTITIPKSQHRWARDIAYDWEFTQSAVIAAALAVAACHPSELRAVLEAARTANER